LYTDRQQFQQSLQQLRAGKCGNDAGQQLFRTLIFDKWLNRFSVAA
jgi:hypothetical protein